MVPVLERWRESEPEAETALHGGERGDSSTVLTHLHKLETNILIHNSAKPCVRCLLKWPGLIPGTEGVVVGAVTGVTAVLAVVVGVGTDAPGVKRKRCTWPLGMAACMSCCPGPGMTVTP